MRLGSILCVVAVSALAAGCNRSQPAGGGQPSSSSAPSPAAAMTPEQQHEALEKLPAPYSTADLANGQAKFSLCQSCHTLPEGGANMTGPNLWGVVGTKAAEPRGDFKFSDALKAANIVWTPDKIDQWITKPQDMVPGTKMTFAGLNDPKDRTDVIAYLMVNTGYKPK